MNRKISLFAFILLIFVSCGETIKNKTTDNLQEDLEPELIWSEEFDYDGKPDTTFWQHEIGYRRNKEAQYYTDKLENCRVENGNLVIEARPEKIDTFNFTSASIHTKNKVDFLYGRIEAKAKLPKGLGTWPAIWMLGKNNSDVGWPNCGEIDILENVGYNQNLIYANIHTKAYNHVIETNKGDSIIIEKNYENYHIYAIEWTEDKIDFFVDSTKYFTFKNDHKGNDDTWPFGKEHYLILNFAVGGAWGGLKGIDTSAFPQKYYIDYVRYYK